MISLSLDNEVAIEVSFKGQVFQLREPTVDEIEKFKDAKGDSLSNVVEFLDLLGLPKDVCRALPISKLKLLVETIVEGISEKK